MMTKRFHTTKDIELLIGTYHKLYDGNTFICFAFGGGIYTLLNILNRQDQRIKALESVLEFATDTITEHCSKKRIKELHEYMKSEGVLLE